MYETAGAFSYKFEADTSDLDKGFESVRQRAEDLVKEFDKLDKASELDSLKKGVAYLTEELNELEVGTVEYNQTAAALKQELAELARMEREVASANSEVASSGQEATSVFSNIAQGIKNVGLKTFKGLALGATTSLTGLMAKGIQATNFLEVAQTSMSGLLGSMEAGNKAMTIAAKFWQSNPFQRDVVTSATQQLVQYGRTLDQLNDDLYTLKPIAMSSSASLDELAVRYGRVAAAGRAMTDDIEVLSYRGIPINKALAEQLGTTENGVREFASQGKISFEVFKTALQSAVNPEALEQFEQTLDRANDKLGGSISDLAGALAGYSTATGQLVIDNDGLYRSWVKLIRTIAGDSDEGTGLKNPKLIEGLNKIGDAVAKLVNMVADHLEPVFKSLANVVDFLGDHAELLIPIALSAVSAFGSLVQNVPVLNKVFGTWGEAIGQVGQKLGGLLTKKPLIVGLIAVISAALFDLLKNDEEFRKSLSELFGALMEIVKNLLPVFQTLAKAFMDFATNDLFTGTLKLVVGLVAQLTKLLASIPTEVLAGIVTAILAVKMSSISPWLTWITAIGLIVSLLKDLAPEFMEAAHNAVTGFVNGLIEGTRKAVDAAVNLANRVVQAFRKALKIASPSKVMEGVGLNVGLGLAEGIDASSSVVNKAMDSLASDVLSTANKVISNKKDFGLLDVNQLYKEWKKVANLFTIGSKQYESAIEQMEEARKNVNLEIINLQKKYNDTLDQTIDKISSFYGLFDSVNLKAGKNAGQIVKDLSEQVARTQEWASAQEVITGLDIDEGLKKQLQAMGVDTVSELSAIAGMTTGELENLNTLWLQKQEIATKSATNQLEDFKNETLNQISELADGIDGDTVEIQDVGGRLVANIGEGITGALPTLDNSLSQMNAYIAEAIRESSSGSGTGTGGEGENNDPLDPVLDTIVDPKKIVENLTEKVKKNWPTILMSLGGLLVGKALWNKFGDFLKLKIGDGVKNSVSNAVQTGLSGVGKVSKGLKSTAGEMSGLDKVYSAIAKGAVILLLIAADIWAISSAIKKMNENLKGIEWKEFGSNLGMMAAAITAMAVLDGILGIKPIAVAVAIGGAIMLELAVDIVAISGAIKEMDENIPDDVDRLKPKIILMAGTIGAFEVLLGLGGLISGLASFGFITLIEIAYNIRDVAQAIGEMDRQIPNDIGKTKEKFNLLVDVIKGMAESELGRFIGLLGAGIEAGPIWAVAEAYKNVAKACKEIGSVDFEGQQVLAKVDKIKEVIEKLQSNSDWLTNLFQSWQDKYYAESVESVGRIVQTYGDMVDSLNKIATMDFGTENISKIEINVLKIHNLVSYLADTLTGIFGIGLGRKERNVESVKNIIKDFAELDESLTAIQDMQFDKGSIVSKIEQIAEIVNKVATSVKTDDYAKKRSLTVGHIHSIINEFREMASTLQTELLAIKLDVGSDEGNTGIKGKINEVVGIIKHISEKIDSDDFKGIRNKERIVGDVQSIINKFTGIVPTVKQLVNQLNELNEAGNAITSITKVRDMIWEISQINTSGSEDLETKKTVVETAVELAKKFKEFADTLKDIEGGDKTEIIKSLVDSMNALLQGVNEKISGELENTKNVGVHIGEKLVEGITSTKDLVADAGRGLQSALWQGVQDKFADEYQQGVYLAYSLKDGIVSVLGEFQTVGGQVQSNFWQGVQNRMRDEYYQGRSFGETFRQGIYDVDYANSGWWAVQGFINGVNNRGYYSGGDSVYWVGYNIANTFLKGLQKRADEHSPWKTTFQSGQFAVEGLIEGMESLESEVVSEAETLADGITGALDDIKVTPTLEASGSYTGGLAPTMEMSGTTYGASGGVTINSNINAYTDYDLEKNLADMSYALSKV